MFHSTTVVYFTKKFGSLILQKWFPIKLANELVNGSSFGNQKPPNFVCIYQILKLHGTYNKLLYTGDESVRNSIGFN